MDEIYSRDRERGGGRPGDKDGAGDREGGVRGIYRKGERVRFEIHRP